jgi:hypothetical protein
MYKTIHQSIFHPILKRWALKEPNYSFTELSYDRWILPRWMHHFVIKATLQGVWPLIPMFLFGWSPWIVASISMGIMLMFKNWRKRPVNILDWICDSSLQVMWPIGVVSVELLFVLIVVYLITKPYASP